MTGHRFRYSLSLCLSLTLAFTANLDLDFRGPTCRFVVTTSLLARRYNCQRAEASLMPHRNFYSAWVNPPKIDVSYTHVLKYFTIIFNFCKVENYLIIYWICKVFEWNEEEEVKGDLTARLSRPYDIPRQYECSSQIRYNMGFIPRDNDPRAPVNDKIIFKRITFDIT